MQIFLQLNTITFINVDNHFIGLSLRTHALLVGSVSVRGKACPILRAVALRIGCDYPWASQIARFMGLTWTLLSALPFWLWAGCPIHETEHPFNNETNVECMQISIPDSKVHGANMGPTWVMSAPGGPHVGPTNLAIRDVHYHSCCPALCCA